MSIDDEELQNRIQKNESGLEDSMDVDAYRIVFKAMHKDPGYKVRSSLADKVVDRMIALREKRETRKDFLWFLLVTFVLFVGALISVLYLAAHGIFTMRTGIFSGLAEYKGLIFLTGILLVVFNWLDKKYIRVHKASGF